MNHEPAELDHAASLWVMQTHAADFADWDGLAEWMAQSPAHADAFNRLSALDDAVAGALAAAPGSRAANDEALPRDPGAARRRLRSWVVGSGLVAAGLAGLSLVLSPDEPTVYATLPGKTLEIALGSGIQARLNGDTQLQVLSADGRRLNLVRGEATFTVVHGSGRPMEVSAGRVTVRDLGTVFNVLHANRMTEVGVVEGSIEFRHGGQAVTVGAGRMARLQGGREQPELFAVPTAGIAGWQQDQLYFRDADMPTVAAALARRLGVRVVVGPGLADRRFTGALGVKGGPAAAAASIAPMLGVRITKARDEWVLDAAPGT